MKNHKGEIATLLTLGLVLFGGVVTLALSYFSNSQKNIASNPRASTQISCSSIVSGCSKSYYACGSNKYSSLSSCTNNDVGVEGPGNYCKRVCVNTPPPAPATDSCQAAGGSCEYWTDCTTTISAQNSYCDGKNDGYVCCKSNTDPATDSCKTAGGNCAPSHLCSTGVVSNSSANSYCSGKTTGNICCRSGSSSGTSSSGTQTSSDAYNPGTTVVGEGKSCCFKKKGQIYVYSTYQSMVNNEMLDDNGNPDCARQTAAVVKSYQAENPPGAFVCSGEASTGMSEQDYEDLYQAENTTVEEETQDTRPNDNCRDYGTGYYCGAQCKTFEGNNFECKAGTGTEKKWCCPKSNQQINCNQRTSNCTPAQGGEAFTYYQSTSSACGNGTSPVNDNSKKCFGSSSTSCTSKTWTEITNTKCEIQQASPGLGTGTRCIPSSRLIHNIFNDSAEADGKAPCGGVLAYTSSILKILRECPLVNENICRYSCFNQFDGRINCENTADAGGYVRKVGIINYTGEEIVVIGAKIIRSGVYANTFNNITISSEQSRNFFSFDFSKNEALQCTGLHRISFSIEKVLTKTTNRILGPFNKSELCSGHVNLLISIK